MAMGTLVSFIERAADLLAPIDRLRWQQLLASAWMATDGTGLKVLVPGLPAAPDGYIELYRNLSCAVFQYAAKLRLNALFAGSTEGAHPACRPTSSGPSSASARTATSSTCPSRR